MATIVIDAMGGDNAPNAVVEGAAMASLTTPHALILVGHEQKIRRALRRFRHDSSRLKVHHAAEVIGMSDKAREGIEAKPDASITAAMRLLAGGEADALVGAGNTGACILAAARNLKRIEGIRRAALAAIHPTHRRHGPYGDPFGLLLDVGATLDAGADDLVRFALMGSVYARIISRNESPRIGLLSNGEEKSKGSPAVVEANRLLSKAPGLNFKGNVEGLDIPQGTVDVVVCNGFTGNIVIKMLEGISEIVHDLAIVARPSLLLRTGLLLMTPALRRIMRLTDWESYGGAPLLGFERVVIKAHGRSGPRAIRNAIKVAAKAVNGRLGERISEGVATLEKGLVRG